jgi:hypothetical protein
MLLPLAAKSQVSLVAGECNQRDLGIIRVDAYIFPPANATSAFRNYLFIFLYKSLTSCYLTPFVDARSLHRNRLPLRGQIKIPIAAFKFLSRKLFWHKRGRRSHHSTLAFPNRLMIDRAKVHGMKIWIQTNIAFKGRLWDLILA